MDYKGSVRSVASAKQAEAARQRSSDYSLYHFKTEAEMRKFSKERLEPNRIPITKSPVKQKNKWLNHDQP